MGLNKVLSMGFCRGSVLTSIWDFRDFFQSDGYFYGDFPSIHTGMKKMIVDNKSPSPFRGMKNA